MTTGNEIRNLPQQPDDQPEIQYPLHPDGIELTTGETDSERAIFEMSAASYQEGLALEKEGKAKKGFAKSLIEPILHARKAKRFAPQGTQVGGSFTVSAGVAKVNHSNFIMELVAAGVNAGVISKAAKKATSAGKPFVKYNAPRGKGK